MWTYFLPFFVPKIFAHVLGNALFQFQIFLRRNAHLLHVVDGNHQHGIIINVYGVTGVFVYVNHIVAERLYVTPVGSRRAKYKAVFFVVTFFQKIRNHVVHTLRHGAVTNLFVQDSLVASLPYVFCQSLNRGCFLVGFYRVLESHMVWRELGVIRMVVAPSELVLRHIPVNHFAVWLLQCEKQQQSFAHILVRHDVERSLDERIHVAAPHLRVSASGVEAFCKQLVGKRNHFVKRFVVAYCLSQLFVIGCIACRHGGCEHGATYQKNVSKIRFHISLLLFYCPFIF